MKKLFIAAIMPLTVIFIYWVAIYYMDGYNLTDNVAHLNLNAMLNNFNYELNFYGFDTLDIIADSVLSPINKMWTNLLSWVDSTSINFGSSNIVKLVLNGVNNVLKFLNQFVEPLNRIIKIADSLETIIENTLSFFVGFIKFLLYPQFI